MRNLALKKYRANTARKRNGAYDAALEEIADCFPAAGTPEEAAEAGEVAGMVDRWLASLDRESRVLFVRRYWYGDSVQALAARLQTSRHRVSVRLSRLRKALKEALMKEGVFL